MGTLVKAPSPNIIPKWSSLGALGGTLLAGKRATSSLPMEHSKWASGGLKVGAIPSGISRQLQSRTKLLEKVFPIMSTFLRNKTISKMTPLRKENRFLQINVASHKCPRIRLSFEYTRTQLSGEGGEGRIGKAMMFRKMLSKYTIFATVLSKIVASCGQEAQDRVSKQLYSV